MENGLGRKDWVLLTIFLADGQASSPVQLQKSIFLFKNRLPAGVLPADFYQFVPYNYGPFCQEIYTDAELLEREGLVKIDEGPNNIRQYAATADGLHRGLSISQSLPDNVLSRAKEIVGWVRSQSFRALVSAIYREFPDFMANSIFKG